MKKKLTNPLKIFHLLCLLSLVTPSCTTSHSNSGDTNLQTISLVDRNGMTETINNPERIKQYQAVNFLCPQPYEKVLRINNRTKQGNIPSFLHSYHENGQPKQYLEIVNSRALGAYKEWHANGIQRLQACVIGGDADLSEVSEKSWIFDGHAYAWDEEGNLIADISYQKGLLHGESLYYHTNGCIWRRVPFCDGQIHGAVEVYLDDGQLFQRSEYANGKLHGCSFRYWPSCKLAVEEQYQNNLLIYGLYYDQKGELVNEVQKGDGNKVIFGRTEVAELHEFRNGVPEGEIKVFGTDQKLLRRYHIKNNIKHGEEIEYYEMPHIRHIPKLLVTWYEGKVQGISKTWYDNGIQESNREMSSNAKNGISTAWYRDGSLMLIEEYYKDKLVKGEYFRRGEKHPISTVAEGSGTVTLFDAEGNFVSKILYDNGTPTGTG